MTVPTYPTARAVAPRVQEHFATHIAALRIRGRDDLATPPDESTIETIIDAAFWASLRREEGLTPKISLAFVSIGQSIHPLTFERPLPLHPATLAKVAPAVERPGIHLGVWPHEGELRVWGTTRTLPPLCFVIEVVASGLLVIKHRSEPFGKFVNVAVIEGDTIKIVDENGANIPDCPNVLRSLLGSDWLVADGRPINVLVQLSASMRAHGRGGMLLVVPGGTTEWKESIVSPVLYAVDPPYLGLTELVRHQEHDALSHEWQEDLGRAVAVIAGLTAVDGAAIVTDRFELLAFGTKIVRRRGNPVVERVIVTEPIEGSTTTVTPPVQLGGTRHLSAAQFVHDQRTASALVASQDGRFTVFTWSPCEDAVHAHRVEALLL
jgi:sensor domain DACNV-containing protein